MRGCFAHQARVSSMGQFRHPDDKTTAICRSQPAPTRARSKISARSCVHELHQNSAGLAGRFELNCRKRNRLSRSRKLHSGWPLTPSDCTKAAGPRLVRFRFRPRPPLNIHRRWTINTCEGGMFWWPLARVTARQFRFSERLDILAIRLGGYRLLVRSGDWTAKQRRTNALNFRYSQNSWR
jgi:hypothetical protein